MDIGQRIKSRRLQLGLTQEDLAKRLGGISKNAVWKAEHSVNVMTTDRIEKYAKALECTSAYLLGWEDDVPEFEDDHIELIDLYSKLNKEQKKTVMDLLRSLALVNQ